MLVAHWGQYWFLQAPLSVPGVKMGDKVEKDEKWTTGLNTHDCLPKVLDGFKLTKLRKSQ